MWQICARILSHRRRDVLWHARALDPLGVQLRARRRFVESLQLPVDQTIERHLFVGSREPILVRSCS
ncbi:hypothetical protein FQN60_006196 [Etheostoma spectabile]|uniref:Uncharacterized protein n=1 Tax=Etheostoma spectabile TaxID=54343 RepID=A0A5J5CP67_9PERO|nr:hypothetical protein FQN60_006196 [Etheostoma spectabile]